VPPVRGGAIGTSIVETASRLRGRRVVVVSPVHPGLPSEETVGLVEHRRVDPSAPTGSSRTVGPQRAKKPPPLRKAYAQAAGRALEGFTGAIVVGNRPQFLPALRSAAPDAELVLSLANLHFHDATTLRSFDTVIAWSDFVRRELLRFLGAEGVAPEVVVIRGGVDLDRFHPASLDERATARRSLALPEQGPIVLFAGRVVEYKGLHLLVEAWPAVRRRHPGATLVVVGAGAFGAHDASPYEEEVHRQAERAGGVRWAGFVTPEQTPPYWAAADVFCGPALWDEPLGLVYLESMASGIPPIGVARGGIPEIISHDETGVLLPTAPSALDVEEALDRLLVDPALRVRLGRCGREVAEQRFGWEASARATEALADARFPGSTHGVTIKS